MRSILLCIGSWPCAALPLEVQINQETLRIEDLADVEMRAPIDGMRDQGFTILRDMLQGPKPVDRWLIILLLYMGWPWPLEKVLVVLRYVLYSKLEPAASTSIPKLEDV